LTPAILDNFFSGNECPKKISGKISNTAHRKGDIEDDLQQ
jgi:hypothetical protein